MRLDRRAIDLTTSGPAAEAKLEIMTHPTCVTFVTNFPRITPAGYAVTMQCFCVPAARETVPLREVYNCLRTCLSKGDKEIRMLKQQRASSYRRLYLLFKHLRENNTVIYNNSFCSLVYTVFRLSKYMYKTLSVVSRIACNSRANLFVNVSYQANAHVIYIF